MSNKFNNQFKKNLRFLKDDKKYGIFLSDWVNQYNAVKTILSSYNTDVYEVGNSRISSSILFRNKVIYEKIFLKYFRQIVGKKLKYDIQYQDDILFEKPKNNIDYKRFSEFCQYNGILWCDDDVVLDNDADNNIERYNYLGFSTIYNTLSTYSINTYNFDVLTFDDFIECFEKVIELTENEIKEKKI